MVGAIAEQEGVDPVLLKALVEQESNWNNDAISSAGAVGLTQLMPRAAAEVGVRDRKDIVQNITGGARYLKKQLDRFGDTALALAAYNWGPSRVVGLLENPRRARIAAETLNYVPGVFNRMQNYGQMEAPSSMGLAFFPRLTNSMSDDTRSAVRRRAGIMGPQAIERAVRTGNIRDRLPATSISPQPLQGDPTALAPSPVDQANLTGQAQAATGGAPIDPQQIQQAPQSAVRQKAPTDMRSFLKAQFGPLADVADPFPKAYDEELTRLINRA